MGNIIEVIKGEENRAKLETVYKSDIFFDDVYKEANKLVVEIIEKSEEIQIENEYRKEKNYRGYGNNMIIFSGDRGQGKTSAMMSYANFLKKWCGDNEKVGDFFTKEQSKIFCSHRFQVLKAIDPSALSSRENIIHVLLIRLFHEMDVYLRSNQNTCEVSKQQIDHETKMKMVKLFEHCYDNLAYIKDGHKKDIIQDNLETLAQYGNSTRLKENLYELIELFLKIKGQKDCCVKRNFLVIPIDDADLSTSNVFEICEDIHNYLSFSNVIILQAINFEQIRRAIYQRYLQQYKDMCTLQNKEDIADKCYHMATKYLEKMMPYNHYIELPYVKFIADEGANSKLLIKYHTSDNDINGDTTYELNCDISRKIYDKTGILLPNRDANLHPFLPHTMRELTVFLNILDNMKDVNFQIIFNDFYSLNKTYEKKFEIIKWEKNLQKFKAYFLQYWCANRLDPMQMQLLKKLDEHDIENIKRIKASITYVREYIKRLDSTGTFDSNNANTYHDFLHSMETHVLLQKEEDLQEALHLYFSIFLNEWFATACTSQTELKKFLNFVGTPFYYSVNYRNAKYGNYYVTYFETSGSQFDKDETHDLLDIRSANYINTFCKNANENEDVVIEILPESEVDVQKPSIYEWNDEAEKVTFDLLGPFMSILRDSSWQGYIKEILQDAGSGKNTEKDSELQLSDEFNESAYLIYTKDILTNYELHKNIGEKIDDLVRRIKNRNSGKRSWRYICEEIYKCLDCDISMITGKPPVSISQLLIKHYDNSEDSTIIENIFLGNVNNDKVYDEELKNRISEEIEELKYRGNKLLKKVNASEMSSEYLRNNNNNIFAEIEYPKIIKLPQIIAGNSTGLKIRKSAIDNINICYNEFRRILREDLKNILAARRKDTEQKRILDMQNKAQESYVKFENSIYDYFQQFKENEEEVKADDVS